MAAIPEDYGEKAKLEKLGYTSVTEMLAERFHMDETFLKSINPGSEFQPRRHHHHRRQCRRRIRPARLPASWPTRAKKQVFAYDADNKLIVAYPATIGSSDTPSPVGHARRIARRPQPRLHLQSEAQLQAGRERQDPDHPARPERSGRRGLDRARQADLRRSRHARSRRRSARPRAMAACA